MKNKNILVNGLLRHEVVNPDGEQEHLQICKIYHNRDKNAVQNMISIVEELKKTFTIYKKSRRGKSNSFSFRLCRHDSSSRARRFRSIYISEG